MRAVRIPNLCVAERVADDVVEHLVGGRVVEAAVGEHDDRFGREVVRVAVEERVEAADGRVARRAVGVGGVGVLGDFVLLRGLHREDRVVQLALQLHVGHRQVELVVAQLREDVERGVVHRDVLQVALVVVGAQGAAGVERVAEGVDVEVAREAARHHVGLAGERTGGVLLAQRSHDLNRRADFAADVEIVAEIDRVAVHLVRDAPAVVAQEADRGVGARLLGAGRDAERVLVHEVVGEQLVEPVGVGPGVLHQEVVARLPRVLQPEFAAAGVVGVDLVVHDAAAPCAPFRRRPTSGRRNS